MEPESRRAYEIGQAVLFRNNRAAVLGNSFFAAATRLVSLFSPVCTVDKASMLDFSARIHDSSGIPWSYLELLQEHYFVFSSRQLERYAVRTRLLRLTS